MLKKVLLFLLQLIGLLNQKKPSDIDCSFDISSNPFQNRVGQQPDLIPRRVLFKAPDAKNLKLSPDGRYLALLKEYQGTENIWLSEIPKDWFTSTKTLQERPLTRETGRGIFGFQWLHDKKTIVFNKDDGGNENWRRYKLDVTTGRSEPLDSDDASASLMAKSPLKPDQVVLLQGMDPYLLNLRTGNKTLIMKNTEFLNVVFDKQLEPQLAMKANPDASHDFYLRKKEKWVFHRKISSNDSTMSNPIGFDNSGNKLYWVDTSGRNTAGLIETDMTTGKNSLVYASNDYDIFAPKLLINPTTGKPEIVAVITDIYQSMPLNKEACSDLKFLSSVTTGSPMVADTSDDFNIWLVEYWTDDEPVKYYLYNRQLKKAKEVLSANSDALEYQRSRVHSIVIQTRDGLREHCVLSVPLETDLGHGKPLKPLPMVLLVHGGPISRDAAAFDEVKQLLTNRGYATLSCNFRGSFGFGKAFLRAGEREWGGKMQLDLNDAVQYAIQNGIADPEKIAIMGGSYGGYATVIGLEITPNLFACGVDAFGPTDLIFRDEFKSKSVLYRLLQRPMDKIQIGDPDTEAGRALLRSISPIRFVDRIVKPLLVGQGANDARVNQSESDNLVADLKRLGRNVSYVLFPDEGHGFALTRFELPTDNQAWFGVVEAFLKQCLGGRVEAFDMAGSSMEVVEAGNIPGI